MSDAPIELVAHDPTWALQFEQEAQALSEVLGPWLVGPPEHIGSTAVPGLMAKPVIDIMAPVATLADSRPAIEAAARLAYVHFPYQPEQMHWFCKPGPSWRTHHLHLVPLHSSLWRDRLDFRNALRLDATLREAYQGLKLALATSHRSDREAYTEAKGPFVADVLRRMRGGLVVAAEALPGADARAPGQP